MKIQRFRKPTASREFIDVWDARSNDRSIGVVMEGSSKKRAPVVAAVVVVAVVVVVVFVVRNEL